MKPSCSGGNFVTTDSQPPTLCNTNGTAREKPPNENEEMDNIRHRYAPHAAGHGVNERTAPQMRMASSVESPVRTLIIVAVAVICTPASVIVASMDRMDVIKWLEPPKRRPMISALCCIARRKAVR